MLSFIGFGGSITLDRHREIGIGKSSNSRRPAGFGVPMHRGESKWVYQVCSTRTRRAGWLPCAYNAPGALSGAAVAPGDSTTGKLNFDVVGDVPNSVVVGAAA
jgi:hypothetical protein